MTPQAALRVLLDVWESHGWRDHGSAALRIVETIRDGDGAYSPTALHSVPETFLERNGIDIGVLSVAVGPVLATLWIGDLPEIVPMDTIDSFAAAAQIAPQSVRLISSPLKLEEKRVKQLFCDILGEPFVANDSAAEQDDIFTNKVRFQGAWVTASFALKGPGTKGSLTLKKMGTNGDQLVKMMGQPANVFVVQHAQEIAPSVRKALEAQIIAARVKGRPNAVGCLIDGTDTARLLVAHGLIDPQTGRENWP